MGKFQFLKQKKFYINILIIIILSFILLWLTIKLLNVYTRHGKVYNMPDFTGMTIEEVKKEYGNAYHYILIDSIYSKTERPGSIVQQDPLPDAKVKRGRNVYYIIVAKTPEKTTMPNLNNLSLRQALVLLESNGLMIKELIYVQHFARNAIKEQRYQDKVIKPGTELIKGSKVTLYVGRGTDNKNVSIPNLYGKPASEVQHLLNMNGLNLGNENYDDHDSIQYMKVYKTEPSLNRKSVSPGTFVNVWYHSSRKFDFDKERKAALLEDSIQEAKRKAEIDSLATMKGDSLKTTIDNTIEENYEDEF